MSRPIEKRAWGYFWADARGATTGLPRAGTAPSGRKGPWAGNIHVDVLVQSGENVVHCVRLLVRVQDRGREVRRERERVRLRAGSVALQQPPDHRETTTSALVLSIRFLTRPLPGPGRIQGCTKLWWKVRFVKWMRSRTAFGKTKTGKELTATKTIGYSERFSEGFFQHYIPQSIHGPL